LQSTISSDLLEIWLQTVIARRLSVQGRYTKVLLNLDPKPFLLQNVAPPVDDTPETFARIRVTVLTGELGERVFRLHGLKVVICSAAVFQRMARVNNDGHGALPSKAVVLNLLRGMLSAMRDNLGVSWKYSCVS
jgi:hypothetical protein